MLKKVKKAVTFLISKRKTKCKDSLLSVFIMIHRILALRLLHRFCPYRQQTVGECKYFQAYFINHFINLISMYQTFSMLQWQRKIVVWSAYIFQIDFKNYVIVFSNMVFVLQWKSCLIKLLRQYNCVYMIEN